MPNRRNSKKNADLGEQFWVRDGKAEHLAFLVMNAESTPGKVCIQWSDRGDREYVPKDAILRSVVDEQQKGESRDRRSRRRRSVENSAANNVGKESAPKKTSKNDDEMQREVSKPIVPNEEEGKEAPPDKEPRKPLSSKRRLSSTSTSSFKRQVLKEVQITDQGDDVSDITEEACPSPKIEYVFKGSRAPKKTKKWQMKAKAASTAKKRKRETTTRNSKQSDTNKKSSRIFRPSNSNNVSREKARGTEQPRNHEETCGDPFEFSETSPTMLPAPANKQVGSRLYDSPLKTPHAEVKNEQLPFVTATRSVDQKQSVFVGGKQCLENNSFQTTTTGFMKSSLKRLSCESIYRRKPKLNFHKDVSPQNVDDDEEDLNGSGGSGSPNEDKSHDEPSDKLPISQREEEDVDGSGIPASFASPFGDKSHGYPTDKMPVDPESKTKGEADRHEVALPKEDEKMTEGKEHGAQSANDEFARTHNVVDDGAMEFPGEILAKLQNFASNSISRDDSAKDETMVTQTTAKTIAPPSSTGLVSYQKAQISPSTRRKQPPMLQKQPVGFRDDNAQCFLSCPPPVSNALQHRHIDCQMETEDLAARGDKRSIYTASPPRPRAFGNASPWNAADENGGSKKSQLPMSPVFRRPLETQQLQKVYLQSPLSLGSSTGENMHVTETNCRASIGTLSCYQQDSDLNRRGLKLIASQVRSEADDDDNLSQRGPAFIASQERNEADDCAVGQCNDDDIIEGDCDNVENHLTRQPPLRKGNIFGLAKSISVDCPGMDSTDINEILEDRVNFCISGPLQKKLEQYNAHERSETHATADTGNLCQVGEHQQTLELELDKGIAPILLSLQSKMLDNMITHVSVTASANAIFSLEDMNSLLSSIAGLPNIRTLTVALGGKSLRVRELVNMFAKIQILELRDAVFDLQEFSCAETNSDCNFSALQELHLVGCSPSNPSMAHALHTWFLGLAASAPLKKIWLDEVQGITRDTIAMLSKLPSLIEVGLRCVPVPRDILTPHLKRLHLIDCPGSDIPTALLHGSARITLESLFVWGAVQDQAAASLFQLLQSNATLENISLTVTGGASFILGIARLLVTNTTLRQFDLVILSGIENVDKAAMSIAKALSRHPSVETFRIFAGHKELISEALRARITKLLSTNKKLKVLRLYGVERG